LDIRAVGLRASAAQDLRRAVAKMFADDADWYVKHAPSGDDGGRSLVLRGAEILAESRVHVDRACLSHRDFCGGNVMVREQRFSGLVDWDHAGIAPPESDVGSCIAHFLVTLPISMQERVEMLGWLLQRYRSRTRPAAKQALIMPLLFALDALLDWVVGRKNAPMEELVWATALVIDAICESPAEPLGLILRPP
jgi:aminoglycoside phosphotransferase (APT) family kinase protein